MITDKINQYDLTLDVFSGCAYSCTGCTVKKEISTEGLLGDLVKLKTMLDEMVGDGVYLYQVTLGPTDITTASNIDELIENQTLMEIVGKFEKLNINTTLLSRNRVVLDKLAIFIDQAMGNGKVKLKIPIELDKMRNQRYVAKIRDSVQYLKSRLATANLERVYLIINYMDDIVYHPGHKPGILDVDLIKGFYDLQIHTDVDFDFNLPHIRNGVSDLIKNNKFHSTLVKMVDHSRKISNDLTRDYDGYSYGLFYSEGLLTFAPIASGYTYVKDKHFTILPPWTAENIERQMTEAITAQLIPKSETLNCMGCDHLMSCVQRSVLLLKEAMSESRCMGFRGILDRLEGA